MKNRGMEGSITVFLTFIFLLMMVLIGTVIDMARMRVAGMAAERTLQTAVDAEFTQFDRELFKQYKIFAAQEKAGEEFPSMARLRDYMQASLSYVNVTLEDVNVMEKVYITDHQGEALRHQILEWMKYDVGDEYIESLTGNWSIFESANKDAEEVKEELVVQERNASRDEEMLQLLGLLEGLEVTSSGLKYNEIGEVVVLDSFVKLLCPAEIDSIQVGVSQPAIWNALQEKYRNPLDKINEWEESVDQNIAEDKVVTLSAKEVGEWISELSGVKDKTEQALSIVEKMEDREEEEETFLLCSRNRVKQILETNLEILRKSLAMEQVASPIDGDGMLELKTFLVNRKDDWTGYNIKDLAFDYSSLQINGDVKNPFSKLSEKMGDSLLELVIEDTSKLSHQSMNLADEYYQLYHAAQREREVEEEKGWDVDRLEEQLTKKPTGEEAGIASETFQDYEKNSAAKNTITDSVEDAIKNLLQDQYRISFFNNYVDHDQEKEDMTKLAYEEEYFLGGCKTDIENLESVVTKIVLMRTVMNVLYLLTDQEKVASAYSMAVALVGFTCMAPLIEVTKYTILTGWAVEESLVDVAALLKGKSISIMKTKEEFKIRFTDLACINKNLIQSKVASIPENNKIGKLDYRDYVRLLLATTDNAKKTYRTMDLIQANMRVLGEKEFSIAHCVFGLKVGANYRMNYRFVKRQDTISIHKEVAYSY